MFLGFKTKHIDHTMQAHCQPSHLLRVLSNHQALCPLRVLHTCQALHLHKVLYNHQALFLLADNTTTMHEQIMVIRDSTGRDMVDFMVKDFAFVHLQADWQLSPF
jgi:hypothetical protein